MTIEHIETKHIFHVEYKGNTFQVTMEKDAFIRPNDIIPISKPSMRHKEEWPDTWKEISELVIAEALEDNIEYK
jgi:hypothetical protein